MKMMVDEEEEGNRGSKHPTGAPTIWERKSWFPCFGWQEPLFTHGWQGSDGRALKDEEHPSTGAYRAALAGDESAIKEWEWEIFTSENTDNEGWQYAGCSFFRLGWLNRRPRSKPRRRDFVKRRQWVHTSHAAEVLSRSKLGAVSLLNPIQLAAQQREGQKRYEEGMQAVRSLLTQLDNTTNFKSLATALLDPVALRAVANLHLEAMKELQAKAVAELAPVDILAEEAWGSATAQPKDKAGWRLRHAVADQVNKWVRLPKRASVPIFLDPDHDRDRDSCASQRTQISTRTAGTPGSQPPPRPMPPRGRQTHQPTAPFALSVALQSDGLPFSGALPSTRMHTPLPSTRQHSPLQNGGESEPFPSSRMRNGRPPAPWGPATPTPLKAGAQQGLRLSPTPIVPADNRKPNGMLQALRSVALFPISGNWAGTSKRPGPEPNPVQGAPMPDTTVLPALSGGKRMAISLPELECASGHALGIYGDLENRVDNYPLQSYYEAIHKFTGVPEPDVLKAVWRSQAFRPAHYMALDRARSKIVICVRGTVETVDTITDLVGHPVVKDFGPGLLGLVHTGILEAALNTTASVLEVVLKAAEEHPHFNVLVVGHSLGGGAAALVALLLRNEPRLSLAQRSRLRAVCLAPAAVMTKNLAYACQHFVASIVYRNDVVPRIDIQAVAKFVAQVAEASPLKRALLSLYSVWNAYKSALFTKKQHDGKKPKASTKQKVKADLVAARMETCPEETESAAMLALSRMGTATETALNPSRVGTGSAGTMATISRVGTGPEEASSVVSVGQTQTCAGGTDSSATACVADGDGDGSESDPGRPRACAVATAGAVGTARAAGTAATAGAVGAVGSATTAGAVGAAGTATTAGAVGAAAAAGSAGGADDKTGLQEAEGQEKQALPKPLPIPPYLFRLALTLTPSPATSFSAAASQTGESPTDSRQHSVISTAQHQDSTAAEQPPSPTAATTTDIELSEQPALIGFGSLVRPPLYAFGSLDQSSPFVLGTAVVATPKAATSLATEPFAPTAPTTITTYNNPLASLSLTQTSHHGYCDIASPSPLAPSAQTKDFGLFEKRLKPVSETEGCATLDDDGDEDTDDDVEDDDDLSESEADFTEHEAALLKAQQELQCAIEQEMSPALDPPSQASTPLHRLGQPARTRIWNLPPRSQHPPLHLLPPTPSQRAAAPLSNLRPRASVPAGDDAAAIRAQHGLHNTYSTVHTPRVAPGPLATQQAADTALLHVRAALTAMQQLRSPQATAALSGIHGGVENPSCAFDTVFNRRTSIDSDRSSAHWMHASSIGRSGELPRHSRHMARAQVATDVGAALGMLQDAMAAENWKGRPGMASGTNPTLDADHNPNHNPNHNLDPDQNAFGAEAAEVGLVAAGAAGHRPAAAGTAKAAASGTAASATATEGAGESIALDGQHMLQNLSPPGAVHWLLPDTRPSGLRAKAFAAVGDLVGLGGDLMRAQTFLRKRQAVATVAGSRSGVGSGRRELVDDQGSARMLGGFLGELRGGLEDEGEEAGRSSASQWQVADEADQRGEEDSRLVLLQADPDHFEDLFIFRKAINDHFPLCYHKALTNLIAAQKKRLARSN